MNRSLPRLTLLLVSVCLVGVLGPSTRESTAFPASWPQAYLDSLTETAKDVTPDMISKNLLAVLPGAENITWDPSGSRVLMETWADSGFYPTKKPGDIITVRAGHPIWVSSPPELKSWVAEHAFPESDLTLRLKQMLGMPPEANKTYFAEFWVNPFDLVRPSPDPEITDHEALADFPVSPFILISDTYRDWFNNLRGISYTTDDAHPWTRLGYTYDWGNNYNHVAISEFVIWDGAQVEINAVTETANYVTISPTVIDVGVGTATVGGHLVFNACIPAIPDRLIDVYVLLDTPWGETLSLLGNGGVATGVKPYARETANPVERACATLLDYAVTDATPTGVWTATIAVLPAKAKASARNILVSDSVTFGIE